MKKSWFTFTKINKYIYALAEFNHWEQVVSYLVVDQTQAFLIDTGMGYQSIKKEVNKITTLPVTVLLTHAHWDHIGGVHEFKKVYIYNHSFEKQSLENGFNSQNIKELSQPKMFSQKFLPKKYQVEGVKEYSLLDDEQIIQSDTFNIQVIHTPGHTPGSVCFFIPKLKAIFTGDTLYPGPLYTQLPESDLNSYGVSIKKLNHLFNHKILILPGHNAVLSSKKLLDEAAALFTKIEKIHPQKWEKEIKGKLLSIKLPTL